MQKNRINIDRKITELRRVRKSNQNKIEVGDNAALADVMSRGQQEGYFLTKLYKMNLILTAKMIKIVLTFRHNL